MTARKTGNELFDIFWKEYPARNNKKVTKKASLAWFKSHDPSEETVYDMIQWLKKDKENRELLTSQKQFCPPPQDAIRFLKAEAWVYDEIGKVCTKTSRREATRSKAVYGNNVKELIEHWQGVILEWTPGKLKASKAFMAAAAYPEFAKWALAQNPALKGAKADIAPCSPALRPVKAPGFGCEIVQEVLPNADLPPPPDDDFTGQSQLVDDFVEKYNLFEK